MPITHFISHPLVQEAARELASEAAEIMLGSEPEDMSYSVERYSRLLCNLQRPASRDWWVRVGSIAQFKRRYPRKPHSITGIHRQIDAMKAIDAEWVSARDAGSDLERLIVETFGGAAPKSEPTEEPDYPLGRPCPTDAVRDLGPCPRCPTPDACCKRAGGTP